MLKILNLRIKSYVNLRFSSLAKNDENFIFRQINLIDMTAI